MSEIIQPTRRGFITGLTSLIVAPAIVRVESLMPVKVIKQFTLDDYVKILEKQIQINLEHDILYGIQWIREEWNEHGIVRNLIRNEEIYVKTN